MYVQLYDKCIIIFCQTTSYRISSQTYRYMIVLSPSDIITDVARFLDTLLDLFDISYIAKILPNIVTIMTQINVDYFKCISQND